MIGQEYDTQHFKRTQRPDFRNGPMQGCASMRTAKYLAAVECHDSKEICPAAAKPSSVVWHDFIPLTIGAKYRTLLIAISSPQLRVGCDMSHHFPHIHQGLRMGRLSILLAWSSLMNSSRSGSHFSFRPNLIAMSSKWQIVSDRAAVSTGQIARCLLFTHSIKLRR